jgi:rhodanese-related sulfurtransferase
MIRRVAAEGAALVLLALGCAWATNALAGPERHLSWFPRKVQAVPTSNPAPLPLPAPVAAAPKVEAAKPATLPTATSAPKVDSAAELLGRFPPLLDAPQADINSDQARWLHGHGALFIDARRTAIHAQGHIAGAKVLCVWEDGLADKVEQLSMFTRDLKAPVVLYCSGGDCQDSHLLAQKLWIAGFRNLRIYAAGYPDWEGRGWPVRKGEAP